MRILCISDVHGQCDKLNKLLEKVRYDSSKDKLIIHGDMVDRGTQNVATLLRVKELQKEGAVIIKGNHDQLAEGSLSELIDNRLSYNSRSHIKCGGVNTYRELKALSKDKQIELYNFISELPLYHEIDDYIFVHAGVNRIIPLATHEEDILLWTREEFIYNKAYDNKTVIFGHTPTIYMTDNPYTSPSLCRIWHDPEHKDKIGIDCGSVFGGKLACLELPSKKEYYV
jgi:serine/threonine protein phosphatase 1